MPILIRCSVCGRKARIRDELAGKRVACPGCKAVIAVPPEGGTEQVPPVETRGRHSQRLPIEPTTGDSSPGRKSRRRQQMIRTLAGAGIAGLLFIVLMGTLWWRSNASTHVAALKNEDSTAQSPEQSLSTDVEQRPTATEVGSAVRSTSAAAASAEKSTRIEAMAGLTSNPVIVASELPQVPEDSNQSPTSIFDFQPLLIEEPVTSMVLTEDGKTLVLSHQAADQITIYDILKGKVASTISTPSPRSMLCRNQMVFVANHGAGTISVFSQAENWQKIHLLKVGHPGIVHLSAPQGRYFRNELIVTCHGPGPTASYQDSHIFLLNVQSGESREISQVAIGTVSYNGKLVLTQGSFNLSPSGGITSFGYDDFAKGNAKPQFRGGIMQTPYIYQFCSGSYWLGGQIIFGGQPLEQITDRMNEFFVPDESQRIVYSMSEQTLEAFRLNATMEKIGTREVRYPDSYREFPRIAHHLYRTRDYLLDHPVSFTHGNRIYIFILCAQGGVVLKADGTAFETPNPQEAEPQLAEVDEIQASGSSTGISDSSEVQTQIPKRPVIGLPGIGSAKAAADIPLEGPVSKQGELNEFSPEVARRLTDVEGFREAGDFKSAITEATRIHDELRKERGETDRDTQHLGEMCIQLKRIDEYTDQIAEFREKREFFHASVLAQRVLKIETEHYGVEHPKSAECRAWAAAIRREMMDTARPWLDLESRIVSAQEKKDFKEAIKAGLALCDLKRSTMGSEHTALAASLLTVAELLKSDHRLAESLPYYEEAARITKEFHGAENYRVKLSQDTLADVRRTAKLSRPKQLRIQAIQDRSMLHDSNGDPAATRRNVKVLEDDAAFLLENLGEESATYISTLLNLAEEYRKLGDLKDTERTQELAKQLITRHLGTEHPLYVDLALNLSATYRSIHDLDNCLRYGQDAVVISRAIYGEENATHINALNEYAITLYEVRDFEEEKKILSLAISLNLVVKGANDVSMAGQYANLAHTHDMLGDKHLARTNAEQAIRILKAASATRSTTYVNTLNLLAMLDQTEGDLENAERRFEELISVSREVDGPKHHRYAMNLSNVAGLYHQQGKLEKAVALFEEALPILRSQRDDTFSVQSEEQQLLTSQDYLGVFFGYISVATQLTDFDEKVYDELLKWKGAVFRRQGIGGLSADAKAPLDQLAQQLDIGRRMSEFVSSMLDHPDSSGDQLAALQQLRIQYNAACREVAIRTGNIASNSDGFDIHVHGDSLPEKVAIVDFQEYNHRSYVTADGPRISQKEPRLIAFVVRRSQPVVMVQLGKMDRIEAALRKWQESLMRGEGRSSPVPEQSPQEALAELVWRPVEKHLSGAENVIICPDGSLIEMPFAALPGKQPDSYLIEDYGLTTIPTLHLLPEILKSRPEPRTEVSALLVGDVNFSGGPGSSVGEAVALRAAGFQFSPLPGTTSEINGIAKLFRQIFPGGSLAMAADALPTEDLVYRTAGKNQYIHLATHGFYAPRNWSSGPQSKQHQMLKKYVEQYLPSLLSGLALAGANQNNPASTGVVSEVIQDDGLLTSLEVAALDLRKVDLAVLSACESTLGQAPFGEGMLGLQRAFQIAGARSTVTSLWKVDDAATQALMVEFYTNLWERRMSKLEALRQAQLTMLNRYDASSKELKARGLTLINPNQTAGTNSRLAPYYWAPFVLSGDWR